MSAVLEQVQSPVTAARDALEAAQRELVALDQRIRGYEQEQDERDKATLAHKIATEIAVGRGLPLPKPPRLKPSDADVALPILRGKRKEFAERVADAVGVQRRALVDHVERRYREALDALAAAFATVIAAWREVIGLRSLLDQAGVKGEPLPPALSGEFSLPVVGKLRPICEHHAMHFVAEHALALGEGQRATIAARADIEQDIGMRLPW